MSIFTGSRFWDYSVEANISWDMDIERVKTLPVEKLRVILEKIISWKMDPNTYSQKNLEKASQEWELPYENAAGVVRNLLFWIAEMFGHIETRSMLSENMEKVGFSTEQIKVFWETVSKHTDELEKVYYDIKTYIPGFSKAFWRIDVMLTDTRRQEPPNIRVFLDIETVKPDGDKERIQMELLEKDLHALARIIDDLVIETERYKKIISKLNEGDHNE